MFTSCEGTGSEIERGTDGIAARWKTKSPPTHARVIRSQTMVVKERDFVEAARVAGAGAWRILFIYVKPGSKE
jgi:hypothetical protein